jgi:hypothetical protein
MTSLGMFGTSFLTRGVGVIGVYRPPKVSNIYF